MGIVVLVNDVKTDLDDHGLIVGNSDPAPNKDGKEQAVKIASYIYEKVPYLNVMLASQSERVAKLLHHVRTKSKFLLSLPIKYSDALQERDFGVLTGSKYDLNSDIFHHSRITAEDGESVSQCRDRAMLFLESAVTQNARHLVVSHPFLCQIVTNSVLRKSHTTLTSFWLSKGSFVVFDIVSGRYGLKWVFQDAFNGLLDRQYTSEEIYSDILGPEGDSPG